MLLGVSQFSGRREGLTAFQQIDGMAVIKFSLHLNGAHTLLGATHQPCSPAVPSRDMSPAAKGAATMPLTSWLNTTTVKGIANLRGKHTQQHKVHGGMASRTAACTILQPRCPTPHHNPEPLDSSEPRVATCSWGRIGRSSGRQNCCLLLLPAPASTAARKTLRRHKALLFSGECPARPHRTTRRAWPPPPSLIPVRLPHQPQLVQSTSLSIPHTPVFDRMRA